MVPHETKLATNRTSGTSLDSQFFHIQHVFFQSTPSAVDHGSTPGMAFSSQRSWIGAYGTTRPAGAAARTSIVNACGCTTSRPRSRWCYRGMDMGVEGIVVICGHTRAGNYVGCFGDIMRILGKPIYVIHMFHLTIGRSFVTIVGDSFFR